MSPAKNEPGGRACPHKASSARRESASGAFAKAGLSERLRVCPPDPTAVSRRAARKGIGFSVFNIFNRNFVENVEIDGKIAVYTGQPS